MDMLLLLTCSLLLLAQDDKDSAVREREAVIRERRFI
jgi:hypothetical protein